MPISSGLLSSLLPTFTAKFMDSLRSQALLTRVVNRDLDPAPMMKGDTVNLRLPVSVAPVSVTPGSAPVAPQASTTAPVTLTLDRWYERSMGLTDKDVGDFEAGNMPQQMKQMAVDLVEYINQDGYALMNQRAGFTLNTTPATLPYASTDQVFRDAQAQLDIAKAPMQGRIAIHNPMAYWNALALPNIVQAQFRGDNQNPLVTGNVGPYLAVPFVGDQLVASQTTGALGTGALTVNGVNAAGSLTVSIAKGAGVSYVAAPGDVITIAGHPRSYVIAAAVTVVQGANTVVTLTAPLAIATVGSEAITLIGAGTTYNNSLIFHKDAVIFCSRPLIDMEGAGETYTLQDDQTGLAIRGEITRQHKQVRLAFDCLWGWQTVRASHVGRILG